MHTHLKATLALLPAAMLALSSGAQAQSAATVPPAAANPDNEPAPVMPIPTQRQMEWNRLGFYAFYHYGMNTYTDLEWGTGGEDESTFAPTAVPDPEQWLRAAKSAGMTGGIAVVKHHDGFCLWPTQSTTHSVAHSKGEFARQTNIPRDFAAAARKLRMFHGFYLSPWDRNSAVYGDGTDRYLRQVYLRQFTELSAITKGPAVIWLDGANGGNGYYGGANETRKIEPRTYYDIPNLLDSLHKLFPHALVWGLGGEARWVGNEDGVGPQTCWAMTNDTDGVNLFFGTEKGRIWQPVESDARITGKGWFWHQNEKLYSSERLFQMYLETMGRNCNFILNCPPDRSGRLPQATVDTLAAMGRMLRARLGRNLALKAKATASVTRQAGRHRNYKAANMIDKKEDTYWAAPDGATAATITLSWRRPQTLRYVALSEYIEKGQRVKAFRVETSADGKQWTPACVGDSTTTIGYRRILPLNGSTKHSYDAGTQARYLRVVINDSRACPLIRSIKVY